MRYETYHAGNYLIAQLRHVGALARMKHDGGDIILFEMPTGEKVSVHLIESVIPVYEIRKTLTENAAKDRYTLFILWSDMLLPSHGQRYKFHDWMEALFTLYDDCIYGYDIIEGESYIFPVYFRGDGKFRMVEHGTMVRFSRINCRTVTTTLTGLHNTWWIADFGSGKDIALAVSAELEPYYMLLGVSPGDDRETVKKAYRLLARRYHPDTNSTAEATDMMQRLNEAYTRILQTLA